MPLSTDLIANSNRFNRSDQKEFSIMIIGVPNVGKSSLVNILRNRHLNKKRASAVGPVAGVTRSVLHKIKISEDPLTYLLDTPGILTPNIGNTETGMKLALCSSLQDHLVGEDLIADYLLFWMNKNNRFEYVKMMGLEQPTDEIADVLISGANKLGKTKRIKNFDGSLVVRPDLLAAAQFMIRSFRCGDLGKFVLDTSLLK